MRKNRVVERTLNTFLARSPLVGHINASLEGLTTVRAFNAEKKLQDEFDAHLDLYNSAIVTLRLTMVGFTFYMDLISALFTIFILAWFLFFDQST